jgi:hypothetical protein
MEAHLTVYSGWDVFERIIKMGTGVNWLTIKWKGETLYDGIANTIEEDHMSTSFIDIDGNKQKFYHGTFYCTA